jgi:hypothetical protein
MLLATMLLASVQSQLPRGFEPPKDPSAAKAAASFPDAQVTEALLQLVVKVSRLTTPAEREATLQGSDEVHELGRIAFKQHPTAEELGRLGHLARALFFTKELKLDAAKDGPSWSDVPRNVVLEACNGVFASLDKRTSYGLTVVQFMWEGDARGGDQRRRSCMLARLIILPLVQDGTIHVVGRAPAWDLDSTQWATLSGKPLRESSEKLITCLKYDPFHLSELHPAVQKGVEVPSAPRSWGSKVEPAKLVTVDGLSYIALPLALPDIEKNVSNYIYEQLTKAIIPAGHAGPDGAFVPPTDAELVSYCSREYGAHVDSGGRERLDPTGKKESK